MKVFFVFTHILVICAHLDLTSSWNLTGVPLVFLKELIPDTDLVLRYTERTTSRPSEAFSQAERTSSSPSEETGRARKPSANRGKRRRRNPEWDESQYETEYTTGGETGNELDGEEWERWDKSTVQISPLGLQMKLSLSKNAELHLDVVAPSGSDLHSLI